MKIGTYASKPSPLGQNDKFIGTDFDDGKTKNFTLATLSDFLETSIGVTNHVVVVDPAGDDTTGTGTLLNPYKTIKYAISTLSGITAVNRYTIQLNTGFYAEDPFEVPAYVSIDGIWSSSCIITPTDVNLPLITFNNFSSISGVTVSGVTNSVGMKNATAAQAIIRNSTIANCKTGIEIDHITTEVSLQGITILTVDSTGTSIKVTNGFADIVGLVIPSTVDVLNCVHATGLNSKVYVRDMAVLGGAIENVITIDSGASGFVLSSIAKGDPGALIQKGLNISGADTGVHVNGFEGLYCAKGILINDGAIVNLSSCEFAHGEIGIEIGNTGANTTIYSTGTAIRDSSNLDINILSGTGKLVGASNLFSDEKISIADNATFRVSHFSESEGDESFSIKGELHVGSIEFPSETCLGEGDSYTRGMMAYTYDGSIYTDISVLAKSYTGSTFTFPNNSVNTAIYISADLTSGLTSDYHMFQGLKMILTTAQIGGSIITEYWNGTAWSEIETMTNESSGSYHRKADRLFTVDSGGYQVLFNPEILSDWAKNDNPSVDLNDRYWVRFRIVSSPTTLPVFEQFKLHANRTEYNNDGYQEYFGSARPYVLTPVSWNTFKDAEGVLTNIDLWLSSNTPVGFDNNGMNAGDSIGAVTSLPSWSDTSAPLKVLVAFRIDDVTNDKQFTLTLNKSNDGDMIYITDPVATGGEISDTVTPDLSGYSAGQQIWIEFNLDISSIGIEGDGVYPDSVWLNLAYDSGTGNMHGMHLDLLLLKFRDGGHI